MFRSPHPAGPRAALSLRLAEAILESGGWQGVGEALRVEFGPDLGLRFRPEGIGSQPAAQARRDRRTLSVEGLGAWTLDMPAGRNIGDALLLPLAEILALSLRLADGRPLRTPEMEAALDPLPYAAILLDGEARLVFANAAGDDVLRSRRLFLPARSGARLKAADARADEALEAAAARVLVGGRAAAADWIVPRRRNETRLAIRLRAIGPEGAPPGAARLLLTLRSIGAAHAPDHPPAPLGAGDREAT